MNSIIFRPRVIVGALILASLFFLFSTTLVSAQSRLVPCGHDVPCDICHFVELGNNVLNWLIGVLMVVFAIIAAYAGFKLVTSAGNVQAKTDAKSKLINAIIGLIIVLAGWLLIDTVMKGLLKGTGGEIEGFGVWSKIECGVQYAGIDTGEGFSSPPPTGTGTLPSGCEGCTAIRSVLPVNGNECAVSYQPNCVIRPDMLARLQGVDLPGNGLRVSEAWPPYGYTEANPRGVHSSWCHANATCVDVSFNNNNPSGVQVQSFIQNSANQNLTAVYEVPTAARKSELEQQGVTNVIVVSGINREHFSVYMCDVDNSARACR